MSVMESIYERIGMSELRYMACQDSDTHDEKATRVYVQRLIDLAGERRISAWDFRPGWPELSPTAKAGEAPGGGGRSEQMAVAYERGWRDSPWHQHALSACNALPERREIALMLQWVRADKQARGPQDASFDDIAKQPGNWLQLLGWSPRQIDFADGQAIRKAAHSARVELIALAKIGVI